MQVSLIQRLDKLEDLPAVPNTLLKVLDTLNDPDVSINTLEKILENDPMLTARLLRTANSPYYGFAEKISSISRAIFVLGLNEVRDLIIGLSISGIFSGDLGFEEFTSKDIWLHCIAVARASRYLSGRVDGVDPEEIFTAGLIHDIGRFLFGIYLKHELRDILAMKRSMAIPLSNAEERYGLTHMELGTYLAQRWGLSDMLKGVIRYHHSPQGAGQYTVHASVVFLADQICQKLKIGWNLDDDEDKKILSPKALGLDVDFIKGVAQRLKDERGDMESQWGAIISS
ncbi:MAG: HDOD domain-containing protein [Dissulfurimicrobium sp.]|uniref:HDOD domain-containing protein n=1 Tax=Dissulfurimicrobium TaxID=1769732 RepID=UPI001EDBEBF5|nr:HDOD domain-containing protein [Dissulfurimicrobium hydrothermale]UKL14256.1 HDOD domain-containing protein [Dissulfurimicrobium hydrothermale]